MYLLCYGSHPAHAVQNNAEGAGQDTPELATTGAAPQLPISTAGVQEAVAEIPPNKKVCMR